MISIQQLLGIGAQSVNWYQAILCTAIVYIATLGMVRIGEKRFLGKNTAFDVIVGFILGSMISNGITSPNAFVPTILAGFVLVGMHWLFAWITYRSDWLDAFLKGTTHQLVENGKIQWDEMKKNNITRQDLIQQLRTGGNTEDLNEIKKAYFERSGEVSVIKSPSQLRILEVKVENGVQTIRVVIEA